MEDWDETERIFGPRKELLYGFKKDLSDLKDEAVIGQLAELNSRVLARFDAGDRDEWTMRELFWIGLDLAKVCHWHGDADGRDGHFKVLTDLVGALKDDEPITGQYARWKDVFYPPVGESKVLDIERRSKAGELRCQELVLQIPVLVETGGLNAFLEEKLAWASFRVAKAHLAAGNADGVEALARVYARLTMVRPSMAHSFFLSTVSCVPVGREPKNWLGELGLWTIEDFREEDFRTSTMPDGSPVSPMVSRWLAKLIVEGFSSSVEALLAKDIDAEGWGAKGPKGRALLPSAYRNALYRVKDAKDWGRLRDIIAHYPNGHLQESASKEHSDVLKWVYFDKKEDPTGFAGWLSGFEAVLLRDDGSVGGWTSASPSSVRRKSRRPRPRTEEGSDWFRKPVESGKSYYPSFAEQAIRHAWKGAKELGWKDDQLTGLLRWFEAMPENHGSEWLDRDHAQCLFASGNAKGAHAIYHRLLQDLHRQWWFWWEWSEMMEDASIALGMQALSLALAENEEDGMLGQRRWKFAQNAHAQGASSLSIEVYRRFLQQLKKRNRQPTEEMSNWERAHAGVDEQGGPQSLNELAFMRIAPWVASKEECAMSIEWVRHAGQVELKSENRTRKMAKLSNGRDIEFLIKAVELSRFSGQPKWFHSLVVPDTGATPSMVSPFKPVRPVILVPKAPESDSFGSREQMVVGYVDRESGLTLAYCNDGVSVKLVGSCGPWRKGDVVEGIVVAEKPNSERTKAFSRHQFDEQGSPRRTICRLECDSPEQSNDEFNGFKTIEMALIEKGNRWTARSEAGHRSSLRGLVKDGSDAPLGSMVIAKVIQVHRIDWKQNKLMTRFEVFDLTIDSTRRGPGLREFQGHPNWTTDINGKPIGFINESLDSCFIPPRIAEKPDAQSASQWLAHKGERGWVAFSFSSE